MRKRQKQKLRIRSNLIAALFVSSAVALGAQAYGNLIVHRKLVPRTAALTLGAQVTPKPSAKPTPTAKTATQPLAAASTRRQLAYVPRVLPTVKPAPNSSVNNLVPVTQSSTPAPSAGPNPDPGRGSGPGNSAATYAYTSSNWAGYLSAAGKFTGINGSWVVPSVTGNGIATSADASWIGIGGVTSGDLIQVGTDNTVSRSGQVTTEAFYEMLPEVSTPVPGMVVAADDEITASISQTAGSNWRITISDVTRNESFAIAVTYSSTESSAEWIEEDPSYSSSRQIPFDSFGSVRFQEASATQDGSYQTLAGTGAQAIIMVNRSGQPVATPSTVGSDDLSFSVTGG